MRRATLLGVAALSAAAHAQVQAGPLIESGFRELVKQKLIEVVQEKPIEAPEFPPLPPKTGPLPPPHPPTRDQDILRIINAEEVYRTGDEFRAVGGVRVQYKGWDIVADQVEGNLSTEIIEASGSVRVSGADAVIEGERVRVDVRARTYHAWNTESQLESTLLKGKFLDPLYVQAEESFGSENELIAVRSDSTTCNLAEPHYHIDSQHTTIRPGVRAIFRNLKLKVFGRTLIGLPYLSIPLTEPSYRYIPEFGRTEQDGYYMKARYGIPLKNQDNFDARLDWFEKRGTAGGGDYRYFAKNAVGVLGLYALAGANQTVTINNHHEQKLGWGSLSLDSSYQRNDFYTAPGATLLSTRGQLLIPRGQDVTRLSFYRTSSDSVGFTSSQQTISMNDVRRWGPNTRSTFDVSWATSSSANLEREQVDLKLNADHDLRRATAKFEYQRSIPVGETQNFFSSTDRTPVLSLISDSRRLFGDKPPFGLSFTTALSAGEYANPVSRDHITRQAWDLVFQRPDTSQNRSRLSVNGRFRQSVYSDDTAQYLLGLDSQYNYRLGRDTGINVRYSYLRPYGFSPLLIDRTGNTNVITADLSFRPVRTLLIGAQTGYDLETLRLGGRSPWQYVGVRTEYDPTDWLSLRALSTYDSDRQLWSNHRLDFAYRPGATFVSLGAQYDGFRHTWGSVNLFVDGLKMGRTKASFILQFNGYLEEFQAQQISFTYDLHCWEAVLQILDNQTGFRPGQQVSFFLRLKALPFTSPFGVGTQGQPLGTGTGVRL